MTPNEIYEQIINDSETYEKNWTYIIDGKSGPTGKTWLTIKLNEAGYKAIDKSDILPNYPNYSVTGNRNIIEFSERYKIKRDNKPIKSSRKTSIFRNKVDSSKYQS